MATEDNKISPQMKELDARQQLLVILMEECGELIQECSKNLRRGEFFDQQKFKDEVGDVYTMINLLHEWDVISWDEVEERERIKRRKLSKWSDLIGESETEMYEKENEKVVEGYQSRGHFKGLMESIKRLPLFMREQL